MAIRGKIGSLRRQIKRIGETPKQGVGGIQRIARGTSRGPRRRSENGTASTKLALKRGVPPRNKSNILKFNKKFLGEESEDPIVKEWDEESKLEIKSQYHEEISHSGAHIIGTEFLDSVNVFTTTSTTIPPTNIGEVLDEILVSPLAIDGTRLHLMGQLYQRYRINHFTIHYVPVVPAVQNGSVTMFTSYDPDLQLTGIAPGIQLNRVVMSMETAVMFNVFNNVSITWRANIGTEYWTRIADGNARLSIPALFYILSSSSYTPYVGDAPELTLANLWMSYDIEFFNMGLLDSVATPSRIYQTPTSGDFNQVFLFSNGDSNINQLQVYLGDAWLSVLSPYNTPGMILSCVMLDEWTGTVSSVPFVIEFLTPGGKRIVSKPGIPFYLYYEGGAWGVHSSISGAVNGDRDVTWVSNQSFDNTGTATISFSYRPINLL